MEKMRFHDRGAFKLEEGTRVTYHLHRLRVPKFRLENEMVRAINPFKFQIIIVSSTKWPQNAL